MKRLALFAVLVLWAASSAAQLVEPNQIGVRMGHIHLAVRDVDGHKQFFTSVLGGTIVQNGPLELIQFPGVYVMLRKAEPTGPPAGAIVNHPFDAGAADDERAAGDDADHAFESVHRACSLLRA